MTAEPAVDGCRHTRMQRALNIAKQDDAIFVAAIMRFVHIGLIEDHALTITPAIALAININVASIIVGRDQTQVIADRAGIGIAVRIQPPARRQLSKHGRLHRRNAAQDRDAARAQRATGGLSSYMELRMVMDSELPR